MPTAARIMPPPLSSLSSPSSSVLRLFSRRALTSCASPGPARSLAAAYACRSTLSSLDLRASPDLSCRNALCGGAGGPCLCRLSAALAWLPSLASLDVSGNALSALPDAVWGTAGGGAPGLRLEELIAADNSIAHIGAAAAAGGAAASLRRLDASHNALARAAAFSAWLPRMAALRELRIAGNPVCSDARELAAVAAMLPRGCALDAG